MAKEREVNTVNYSPLRYPGGKSRLAPFISLLIQKSKIETPIYVEPFAGGAGVALSLLLNSAVDEIVMRLKRYPLFILTFLQTQRTGLYLI